MEVEEESEAGVDITMPMQGEESSARLDSNCKLKVVLCSPVINLQSCVEVRILKLLVLCFASDINEGAA